MRDRTVVLEPGEGRAVSLHGTEVVSKVDSDGARRASCVEFTAASGFDTGLHVHQRLEETFYVLDGDFEFRVGDETHQATPGATIFVPPGVPHAFANRGAAQSKLLLIMSPPEHDRYFEELAEILAADGPPDTEAIATLREKYDTKQLSSLSTSNS
jgi:quercetin dioxygenase-like cupin family protein